MKIDVIRLVYGQVSEIEIDNEVTLNGTPEGIISLSPLKVTGSVTKNSIDELYLRLIVSGTMVINDSRSMKEIDYPFNVEIDEKIDENSQISKNILDIEPILWDNIVLEVPISKTYEDELPNLKGEGWELK